MDKQQNTQQPVALTDDEIRSEWFSAGGRVHGPNVETVTMPETDYFALRRALADRYASQVQPLCQHRIADARNPVVKSGYLCVDCGALFSAADHVAPKPEPVNQQMLAALKQLEDAFCRDDYGTREGRNFGRKALIEARAAIAAAEKEQGHD